MGLSILSTSINCISGKSSEYTWNYWLLLQVRWRYWALFHKDWW